MDPSTASYYRSILYHDSQDQRPLPPTLALLHAWAFKRFQAMGAGSIISKQAALCVAMTWMSSTKEGRAFAHEFTSIGELFSGFDGDDADKVDSNDEPEVVRTLVSDWESVPVESKVVVMVDQKSTLGEFVSRSGNGWLEIRVGGDIKRFRTNQVQLAGA